jgi:hypothetical protein
MKEGYTAINLVLGFFWGARAGSIHFYHYITIRKFKFISFEWFYQIIKLDGVYLMDV